MEGLVKQRDSVKSQLSKLQTRVNKHDVTPLNKFECEMCLKRLNEISDISKNLHPQIIVLQNTSGEADTQEDIYEKLLDKCDEIRIKLLTIENELKVAEAAAAAATASAAPPSHQSLVKLPMIELPKFDGHYEQWTSFQDLFLATIDRNNSLSGAQKLQYLKSSLQGEAHNLIRSFLVTDANYDIAWKMLEERYDNQREIVNSLLKRLFSQPALTKESYSDLQQMLDTTNECVRALTVLGRPVDKWDDMLVHLVTEKLDPESKRRWAMSLEGKDVVAFDKLVHFLDSHIRGLAASQSSSSESASKSSGSDGRENRQATSHHIVISSKCLMCKGEHQLFKCPEFLSISPLERGEFVKISHGCFNCLKVGHSVKSCNSEYMCKKCNKRHHTLLHYEQPVSETSQESSVATHFTSSDSQGTTDVLLPTANVKMLNSAKQGQPGRSHLDWGSETSLITKKCAKKLNLKWVRKSVSLTGISSSTVGKVRWGVQVEVQSCITGESILVDALIVSKITSHLPRVPFGKSWKHLEGIQLADPKFYIPGEIDILLGADVVPAILREGRITGPPSSPIAQNTILGWVVSGRINNSSQSTFRVNHIRCKTKSVFKKSVELEKVPDVPFIAPNEQIPVKQALEVPMSSAEQRLCDVQKVNILKCSKSDYIQVFDEQQCDKQQTSSVVNLHQFTLWWKKPDFFRYSSHYVLQHWILHIQSTVFSTTNVNLNSVSDLTTEAFLTADKRFISKRRPCSDVYFVRGTNRYTSRPFIALLHDFNELSALPHGHFPIQEAKPIIPTPDLATTKLNTVSCCRSTQPFIQCFWKRWSTFVFGAGSNCQDFFNRIKVFFCKPMSITFKF